MRRMLLAGMYIGLLACTGCFTNWNAELESKTPNPAVATSKAPPPVRVEQITPENGHQICNALETELAWTSQQTMLSSR